MAASVFVLSETYLGPCQTSMIKYFAKTVNGQKPLTIFAKGLLQRILTQFELDLCLLSLNLTTVDIR